MLSDDDHNIKESCATRTTFFCSNRHVFPTPVDGKINTSQFLEASKNMVALIDLLGKAFAPVKYDMNGNIQKITAKFNEDKEKFQFMNDMVLYEQTEGRNTATDGLLWLRRGYQFIYSFFMSILEDFQGNKKSENLSENITRAYKATLEKYHGWIAKQLFSVLSKVIPSRSDLLKALALNKEIDEYIIFQDMELFLNNLNSNIAILVNFYSENNLETDAKCK